MRKGIIVGACFLASFSALTNCVSDSVGTPDSSTPPDTSTPDVDQKDNYAPTDAVSELGVDTGNETSVDAAPPGPDVIFGTKLVLWLDADMTSTIVYAPDAGTRVIKWKDRSTFANDADVTYASSSATVLVEAKAINNRNAMKLSGVWNNTGIFDVPDKTSLQFGTSDFMIMMVVAYANTPGGDEYGGRGVLWSKATGGWPYWGVSMAANAYSAPQSDGAAGAPDSVIFGGIKSFADGFNAGAWSSKNGWNDANFHVFTMRKDTTNKAAFIRTDGTETQSTKDIDVTQNLSGVGANVHIGGDIGSGTCCYSPLKGYIAEIVAIKGSLGTTLEINQLKAYINGKYALTL